MSDTPWLTVAEAASYLKYSPRMIRAACASDALRHVQPGGSRGRILTRREWLDEWVTRSLRGGHPDCSNMSPTHAINLIVTPDEDTPMKKTGKGKKK